MPVAELELADQGVSHRTPCARQTRHDRPDRNVEDVSELLIREPLELSKHEQLTVAPRKAAQGFINQLDVVSLEASSDLQEVAPSQSPDSVELFGNLDLASEIPEDFVTARQCVGDTSRPTGTPAMQRLSIVQVGSEQGVVTSDYDKLNLSVATVYDVAGSHRSYVVTPSIDYSTPLSTRAFVALSLSGVLPTKPTASRFRSTWAPTTTATARRERSARTHWIRSGAS